MLANGSNEQKREGRSPAPSTACNILECELTLRDEGRSVGWLVGGCQLSLWWGGEMLREIMFGLSLPIALRPPVGR